MTSPKKSQIKRDVTKGVKSIPKALHRLTLRLTPHNPIYLAP